MASTKVIISVNLPPDTVTSIFHGVDAVEAILILFSYPIVATIFYTFYRSPLLHRNLVILIINLFVEFMVVTVARLFCIAGVLIFGRDHDADPTSSSSMVFFRGPFAAAEMIRLIGCCAFCFACPCFIFERFCATIFLKSYETMRHNRIIGFVIALQWGSACLAVYCFCNRTIKTSILIGIFGVIMLFTILVFLILCWINNCRFRLYQQNLKSFCLSERFQLSENLRTQKLLGHLAIILCGANILCLIAFVLMSYGSGNFLQPCLKAVFDYAVVFYGYIFPLISVTSVPDLKISYVVWLIRFRRKIFPQSTASSSNKEIHDSRKKLKHLKNSKGKQMVFTLDQEMAVYYSTLNEMWSEDVKSRRPMRYTPTKYRY